MNPLVLVRVIVPALRLLARFGKRRAADAAGIGLILLGGGGFLGDETQSTVFSPATYENVNALGGRRGPSDDITNILMGTGLLSASRNGPKRDESAAEESPSANAKP